MSNKELPILDWNLNDKYDRHEGRLFLTGTQALVKLPLLQHVLDLKSGLNTAGFISGYRGSPLGNLDTALWSAKKELEENSIIFNPGLNEESAATSVLGTQQVNTVDVSPKYDGIFSMWYGKGPGVDRAADALKHGNFFGTATFGGVLVLAGDDHGGKSSTLAFQSEQALASFYIPVLNPASLADYLELGLFGWALSRATGLWAGFKCHTETVESSGTVDFSLEDALFKVPKHLIDPIYRLPSPALSPVSEEEAVIEHRIPAAKAFARANSIDRHLYRPSKKRLGLITVGKAHGDTIQTLEDMGISKTEAEEMGIGIYLVRMSWPLEDSGIKKYASGYDELFVIEEKDAFVERQVTQVLFNLPHGYRPWLSGKRDPEGRPLLISSGELSPLTVRKALVNRLVAHDMLQQRHQQEIKKLYRYEQQALSEATSVVVRTPAFCSGCPHNRSTKIPEGSLAFAGIGCHAMAAWLPDRSTVRPTQMGGEGANWIGMAPFVDRLHVFQNLGDGTYSHSGLLAIRAAQGANINITYKILFNDAVAMTGGQPVEGEQTVAGIARQVLAEGITQIVVITDDVTRYNESDLPKGVTVYDRASLLAVEAEFKEISGVSVIIYEQTCAAEKRRRRKRGQFPNPAKRYFINSAVCEGCGDCGKASNCVSLHPLPTIFGVKRRIDQSSCNKDYSCVDGFCPSFVTVLGGKIRKTTQFAPASFNVLGNCAAPTQKSIDGVYNLLVTGIGGTGVVTVGAIIGMAAHLLGKTCSLMDMTGLSQKNGAVMSHIRLSERDSCINSTRIGVASADAVIGCDLIVSASDEAVKTYRSDTQFVLSTELVPVAAFQQNRDLELGEKAAISRIKKMTSFKKEQAVDATAVAEAVWGNAILANIVLLGVAFQRGLVPLNAEAIDAAIVLNNVSVENNRAAFNVGRRLVVEPDIINSILGDGAPHEVEQDFPMIKEAYEEHLKLYQDKKYARSYSDFITEVYEKEQVVVSGSSELATTVARQLGKLMSYKDEYEVGRLHASGDFIKEIHNQFSGKIKLQFNMAPPLFSTKDPYTGLPVKREYGSWMLIFLKVLARFKFLRGTSFDVFGHTLERKHERQLIKNYKGMITEFLSQLSSKNLGLAVKIAALPEEIRGFGHVKKKSMDEYEIKLKELLLTYHSFTKKR